MSRPGKYIAAGLLSLALVGAAANIPTTGYEGVNDTVIVHHMPLWEKAARFYLRHRDFQRWAEEAAGGERDPEKRVLKLMDWTRRNVRRIPEGWPIIDDHISYTVLRHHGNDVQLAEVFTALATYVGYEGRWWENQALSGDRRRLVISFVRAEAGWWVFDVWNGGWFETPEGRIATIDDFKHPEQLRHRGDAPELLYGRPYLDYFHDLEQTFHRSFSRARGQMPWPRLLMKLGLEPDDGDWRPPTRPDRP